MEYLILFISYMLVPIIMEMYILPQDTLLLMSTFESLVMPYFVITATIFLITVIVNMIRAIRTCPVESGKSRSWGFSGGIRSGITASIFATAMYLLVGIFPILTLPFLSISVLPYSTEIGEGFYVALGGFIGYWMSRIFVRLC